MGRMQFTFAFVGTLRKDCQGVMERPQPEPGIVGRKSVNYQDAIWRRSQKDKFCFQAMVLTPLYSPSKTIIQAIRNEAKEVIMPSLRISIKPPNSSSSIR